jgi:hypothetical protein
VIALAFAEVGIDQDLGETDHRVERRADLVAHVGQELALGAVRRLCGIARHAEFAGLILEGAFGLFADLDLSAQRFVRLGELARARQRKRAREQRPQDRRRADRPPR